MITVVNRKTQPEAAPGVRRFYVGRPSFLGNPFGIGPGATRGEVIEKYREWIRRAIADEDRKVIHALDEIVEAAVGGDIELACWCAPRACHADILREMIELQVAKLARL